MSAPTPLPGADLVVDALRAELEEQPWWARFRNTLTTAAGVVVLIVWLALSVGLGVPAEVLSSVSGLIGLLTVLGVLKTPNGITPKGVDRVAQLAQMVQAAAAVVGYAVDQTRPASQKRADE
ncbi:holin [Gordonia phage Bock]|nr:holin [Gordonia phage Bock]